MLSRISGFERIEFRQGYIFRFFFLNGYHVKICFTEEF